MVAQIEKIVHSSCYDAVTDLDVALKEILNPTQRYFVLGGIPTAAINHPDTIFDHSNRQVIPIPESADSVIRGNNTRRDIDVLVLDILSKEESRKIRERVAEAVGGLLTPSVFGIEAHTEKRHRISSSLGDWTSRRTIDSLDTYRYELYPLIKEVSSDSFEDWTLLLPNDKTISIFNPAGHMLAYYMRSVSGLRHKDIEKVSKMRQRIESDNHFKEEIEDGHFKSWREFSEEVAVLGETGKLSDIRSRIFKTKSNSLRFLESNERLIKLAQTKVGEFVLKPFVGSR